MKLGISVGNELESLKQEMYEGNAMIDRAKTLLNTCYEIMRYNHRNCRPVIGRSEYNAILKHPAAVEYLRKAVDMWRGGKKIFPVRVQAPRQATRVQLPSVLDSNDPKYMQSIYRLQYARNVMLTTGRAEVTVNDKIYEVARDLPIVIALLRPWYREQAERIRYQLRRTEVKQ